MCEKTDHKSSGELKHVVRTHWKRLNETHNKCSHGEVRKRHLKNVILVEKSISSMPTNTIGHRSS